MRQSPSNVRQYVHKGHQDDYLNAHDTRRQTNMAGGGKLRGLSLTQRATGC